MGYIMIRLHSFACDYPDCPDEYEDADYYKRGVWKTLTGLGWRRIDGKYFCPEHGQGVMLRDRVAAADDKPARPERVTARSQVTFEPSSALS